MSTNDYARGFTDALEYVLALFNRLMNRGKLPDPCLKCEFVEQIGKLMLLAKDKQFEKIETDLGYYLT
jgi:tRNA U34 2-thiouridine synthase MnmA/TrmU